MARTRIVLSTFPTEEKARQIGTLLIEKQLAACVNLVCGVRSIYRWEGKVEESTEVLGIFKVRMEDVEVFERELGELHPYEVPEIVVMAPERVAEAYEKWVMGGG